ncbi:MAG: PEP-CTERM sorting domain-containing protein [Planctomycetota bacterium]
MVKLKVDVVDDPAPGFTRQYQGTISLINATGLTLEALEFEILGPEPGIGPFWVTPMVSTDYSESILSDDGLISTLKGGDIAPVAIISFALAVPDVNDTSYSFEILVTPFVPEPALLSGLMLGILGILSQRSRNHKGSSLMTADTSSSLTRPA